MKRDVEFLYEVGMLRYLPRQWQRFGGIDFANLADHHFRVIWIALVIAQHEKVSDTSRIVKMALVHDLAESRTNDVDYLSRQYVSRNEESAIEDIFANVSLADEFQSLIKEYEDRQTLAAKIVKDADNLDVDMELQEQAAKGIQVKKWTAYRQHVADNYLFTDTAKKLFKEIRRVDPNDWHVTSKRNRLNGGDWKKT